LSPLSLRRWNIRHFDWPRYIGNDFFLGWNLVSFNRNLVVPYEISKVNFHAETKILVSMAEEI
jgi:hypothetical protein